MKNFLIKSLIVLFAVAIFTHSCKKYDEGPRLSFRTKKNRVVGKWKVDAAKVNNVDVTGTALDEVKADFGVIEFTKDDEVIFDGDQNNKGKWEFFDNKEQIKITDSDGDAFTAKILRLKNDELWLEFTDGDGMIREVHLIPA